MSPRQKQRIFALNFLGGRCVKCGINYPEVLEFHHRIPVDKHFNISQMLGKLEWRQLVVELKKCDLLCANCHRMLNERERRKATLLLFPGAKK